MAQHKGYTPLNKLTEEQILDRDIPGIEITKFLRRDNGFIIVEFLCACGKTSEGRFNDLIGGKKKTCGCYHHGETESPTWNSWHSMLERCLRSNHKSYARYGGRGITVCSRWRDYLNFKADMGVRPGLEYTIERLENNGNYEPDNCIWALPEKQQNNKVDSVFIEFRGKRQTRTQWARETGLSAQLIHWRMVNGWNIDDALTTPSRQGRNAHV